MDIDWNTYLVSLKARASARPSARTYAEELASPFLEKFRWDNDDLQSQKSLFWLYVYRFMKCSTPHQLTETLEWCASRELHVKQVVKTLSTQIKKRHG